MRFPYQMKHGEIELKLTPLIDVVFLLIIFFLVTSSFVQISGIRVQLPKVATSDGFEKTSLFIEINRKGQYFFEDNHVSLATLKKKFEQAGNVRLTISADKATDFNSVMQVWDLARENGLKEVVVLTEQIR